MNKNITQTLNSIILVMFFVVILTGIFLRFYRIGAESFWFDEIYGINIASFNFGDVISGKIADPGNPSLFFAILSLWKKYFELTESNSRIPAAIFSILTFPLIYLSAKAMYKKKNFWIFSTVLFSVSLFSILYAQEARSYSLFVFLTSLSLWLQSLIIFNRYKKDESKILIGYLIVSLLGFYTHYLFFYVLFLQTIIWGIFLILQKRTRLFLYLLLGIFLTFGIFFLLWGNSHLLPAIFSQERGYDIDQRVGYDFHSLREPRFSLESFCFLVFNGISTLLFNRSDGILNVLFSLVLILPVILLLIFFPNKKKEKKILTFLIFPIVITLFLAVFTSFGDLINNTYYFIFLIPYVTLFVGYLFSLFPFKKLGLLTFSIFIILSIFSDYAYLKNPHKTQLREVAEYLLDKTNSRSRVYTPAGDILYVLSYYFQSWGRKFYVSSNLLENTTKFVVKRPQDDTELVLENFQKIQFYDLELYERKTD